MAVFEYQAVNQKGKKNKGTLEADNERQARQTLRDEKLTPLLIQRVSDQKKTTSSQFSFNIQKSLSTTELATITRQLATLIQAAMPIEQALQGVASQQEKSKIRNMLLSIRSKILEGFTFSQSLNTYPKAFPKMYVATVSAGEHSGHLDKVLHQLAEHTELQMQVTRKIQQALVYPIILILTAVGIISFLLGYVVPDIVKVFVDTGQELPSLTIALINTSEVLKNYWFIIASAIILVSIIIKQALKKHHIRLYYDKICLNLPIIGRFLKSLNTARFASTLSILIRSGVPLVESLIIAKKIIKNKILSSAIFEATQKVSEGSSLNKSLFETKQFPPLMIHMIHSGEATGELDTMLERVAQNQQLDLEGRINIFLSLFEPIMLIIMGGIVLLIVMAILLPILNMNQLI